MLGRRVWWPLDTARRSTSTPGRPHYTASQLLDAGLDRRNAAASPGHSGGGATTLRHYADPVPEADRRAAMYLSHFISNAAAAAETSRQQQLVPPGAQTILAELVALYRTQSDLLPSLRCFRIKAAP
jgi:hypothetical protein